MVPTDATGLAILLLAIVPGYITTSFWARTKTWKGRGPDLATVIQSVAVSVVIQVLVSPLTLWIVFPYRRNLDQHAWNVVVWLALVVVVVPIVVGTGAARVTDKVFDPGSTGGRVLERWARTAIPPTPPPTIWDWLFTQRIPDGAFVIVTFSDNARVAGVFATHGGRTSYAITSPQPQGLYLSQEWSLDANGNIDAVVPDTKGVMIANSTTIRSVRILAP